MKRAPDVPSGAVGLERPNQEPGKGLESEVVAFVRGRSVPCPRCGYDLRDIERPRCPECGEPLVLKVGSPKTRFGWLVLAMAPGCFSGVAAVLGLGPLLHFYIILHAPKGKGMPIPIQCAIVFGFLSAASVVQIYRSRHRIMGWSAARQAVFAASVWGVHLLAFLAMVAALIYL